MKKKEKQYVIGVDGGGTKTVTALADLKGNILRTVKTGPSSPRNVGIDKTAENVAEGINKVFKKNTAFVFAGLPAVEEEYKSKINEIEKKIVKDVSNKIKIKVGSDQIVAFRSGTDEKSGVMVIAGTGCVAHGWRGGREAKVSGWGWLADEGSAIWAGRKVFQTVLKDIDNRGQKTSLTNLILKKLRVSTSEKLVLKVYKENFLQILSSLSIVADSAAKYGDQAARMILREAGEEAALAAETVIKNLGFRKKSFPLVLVGSMFKSGNFRKSFELHIKQSISKANIIYPKSAPVLGAVKLAIENYGKR
ncbi:hypothetical protein AMJ47_00780 [Parcubacteria bacterium DG_72]|nr:MAG: hypothetical protein AMJ47_00780 [Parcubacteria bacterium DG_72]